MHRRYFWSSFWQISVACLYALPDFIMAIYFVSLLAEPFDRTNTARSVFQLEAFHRIIQVFCDSSAKINETKDLACVLE